MAEHRPIVVINGDLQQMPAGDLLSDHKVLILLNGELKQLAAGADLTGYTPLILSGTDVYELPAGDTLVTGIESGFTLPDGIPTPLVWFTPRDVELNGSSEITKFLNQGSTGATNDATPETANLATVVQPGDDWGGQDVISIPDVSTGGYTFGNVAEGRTVIGLTTYKTGVETTFDSYDGFVSAGVGTSVEMTGAGGSGDWYFNTSTFNYFIDGIGQGFADIVVLPALKKGLGVTNTGTFSAVGELFYDEFATSRNWKGLSGDVLIFQDVLSDAQILEIHEALAAYYALPVITDYDPVLSLVNLLAGWNGTNGDVAYTEESDNEAVATFLGTAQITTTDPILGSACLDVTGQSSAYVTYPQSTEYDFQSGLDKTIRIRYKRTNSGGSNRETLIGKYETTGNHRSWSLSIDAGANDLEFIMSTSGSSGTVIYITGTVPDNPHLDTDWHEVAITLEDATDTWSLYFDGALISTTVEAGRPFAATSTLNIGRLDTSSTSYFRGYIDEIRISDFLEITGPYVVRTAEFPRVPPPEPYPTAGSLVYEDSAWTGTDNIAVSLTFATEGTYVVAIGGASGGIGSSDSLISFGDIGGFDVLELGVMEGVDYEECAFARVKVTTAGTYTINFTYQGTSYRRYAVAWKAIALDVDIAVFSLIQGYSNVDVSMVEGGAIAAVSNGRGGTQIIGDLDTIDVASTVYEATDSLTFAHENTPAAGTKNISNDSTSGTPARTITGILIIPYMNPDPQVDFAASFVILAPALESLWLNKAKTFIVHGNRVDGATVQRAKTFVILE